MPYAKSIRQPVPPGTPVKFEAEPFHFAIPDQELLDDLAAVARQLKADTIFAQQYQKHGRFSPATLRNRFGDWNAALVAAKLLPSAPRQVDDEAILKDMAQVAEKIGVRNLHRGDYVREGKYGITTIVRRFGSWSRAKLAAGLVAAPHVVNHPTNKELFENFENLWRSLGHQPRGRDVALPHSRFDVGAYRRRFGTFRKALAFFLDYQHQRGKTTAGQAPMEIPIHHKTHREVRAQMRYQILARDHFRCRICGRSPATDPAVKLHIDHIKPWSSGGETTPDNLQTLCETCNAGKGDCSV